METTNEKKWECLAFARGTDTATVMTDGATYTTLERRVMGEHLELETRGHRSLCAACAHLEARGYEIQTEYCNEII